VEPAESTAVMPTAVEPVDRYSAPVAPTVGTDEPVTDAPAR